MRRLRWVIPLVVLLSLLVSSVAFAAPSQGWGGGYWYTVRSGDTLSSIGLAAGVSPWSIAQANGLANPNYIYCGQQLWIPAGGPPPQPYPRPMPAGCGYWRAVYFGDTLYSIAWSTGVSSYAIATANGLYNTNVIYAGSSLWIPCAPHRW